MVSNSEFCADDEEINDYVICGDGKSTRKLSPMEKLTRQMHKGTGHTLGRNSY